MNSYFHFSIAQVEKNFGETKFVVWLFDVMNKMLVSVSIYEK
jgi:hypothetical protein